jgi:hypothetical protein
MLQDLIAGKMTSQLFLLKILSQVAPWVVACMILTTFDLATGIAAARKKGIPIISHKMRDTVIKLLLYFGTIISTVVMDIVVLDNSEVAWIRDFDIMYYLAGFICLIEFKSIIENVSFVTGVDLVSRLGGFFKAMDADKKEP